MATRRSALGRGLGALIQGAGPAAVPADSRPTRAAPDETGGGATLEIEIDRIDANPEQPRRHFDPEQLRSLASSIRQHGVLQPVVVRRAGERYELVVGERRLRAAREAGRHSIPAVVADLAASDRLEVALVENVQRHDLNPIELALAFRALSDAGSTQEQIGERVGLERSTVANHLRLLDLSRELQEDVENGRVTLGHAKALLQASPERRRGLRDRVVAEGLSVREAERLARPAAAAAAARPAPAPPEPRDPDFESLLDSLRSRLQTRVRVRGDGQRGRVEIEYYSSGELDRIVSRILGEAR